jgi:predicted transcriptional regulator
MMNARSNHGRRQRRYTGRHQARLDPQTLAKLDDLAFACHRKRSAILRCVMQWGLGHAGGWTIDQSHVVAVPPVAVLLEPELLQRVQEAAAAHGTSIAAWLREAMRRVALEDFPASWRVGETAGRLHDSGHFDRKYQLRLDEATSRQLAALTHTFHRPAADVIRQLIAQATPEDFPPGWHLAVAERQRRAVQPVGRA